MEIEIDKPVSDDYYGEVFAVMSDYRKLSQNPRRKVKSPKKQALIYFGISLAFLLVFSLLYSSAGNAMYLFVVVLFSAALILSIVYYALISKRISALKTDASDKRLTIEEGHVEISLDGERSRLEMSEISHIIINKYSVSFLPKNPSSKLIAVNSAYADEVVRAVADKSLIVDNSDLY